MTAVFIFSTSAVLLVFFLWLKVGEFKRQKRTWLTRLLSSQDFRLRQIFNTFVAFFENLWRNLVKKTKFLLLDFLPFLLKVLFRKFRMFIFENFKKIKDNVRGKYRKFNLSKPSSKYLEEISKVKDSENGDKKSSG